MVLLTAQTDDELKLKANEMEFDMKILSIKRKCFVFILVAFLMIFAVQSTSYAQAGNPTITASTAQPLTETTLGGSVVTLTLSGGTYVRFRWDIADALTVSGILGVTIGQFNQFGQVGPAWFGVKRPSDTEITVELGFDGDIDTDATLTFTVGAGAIANYNGPALTAEVSVTAQSANEANAEQPEETPRFCQVGDVIAPGESCTYVADGKNIVFSVNEDGEACRAGGPVFQKVLGLTVRVNHLKFCRGDEIERDDTFNSNFAASKKADSSWTINTVPAGTPVVETDPVVEPDFTIQSLQSNKSTLAPDEPFTLSVTVKNSGNGQAPSTTLRYYRSTDNNISTSDTQVGSDSVSVLEANLTSAESISLTAPTTAGTYYYGVCVDSVTNESDTGNNCSMAVSVTVTAPPVVSEDVNEDGVVDVQDLVSVAQQYRQTGTTPADVNDDGVVNIDDLILVAAVLDADAAAAPSLHPVTLDGLTVREVQLWLSQARQRDFTDPSVRRGILFLEQLLASMVPKETALLTNYPNPFNPETWMPYQLATDTDVRITIYSSNGVVVRTLLLGQQSAGYYTGRDRAAYWDGRNALGEQVASGIYFYQLEAEGMSLMRKMVILK